MGYEPRRGKEKIGSKWKERGGKWERIDGNRKEKKRKRRGWEVCPTIVFLS